MHDTFIYYLFAFDESLFSVKGALHLGRGIIEVSTCLYDLIMWTYYNFYLGECLGVFACRSIMFLRNYPCDVHSSQFPCSPSMGLIVMIKGDTWLFLKFESPWLNVFLY